MSGIVTKIVRTKVRPQDLERALVAINDLSPEDRRDLTARSICLIRVFDQDRPKRDTGSLIAAIDWRLKALARLASRPELKAWSLPIESPGGVNISPAVVRATAEEPLIVSNDEREHPSFNPESFFKRLLALSQESGRG